MTSKTIIQIRLIYAIGVTVMIIIAGIFLDSKMNVEEPASVPEGAHA